MSWQQHVKAAESVLESARIPSSPELISLIKRVNPTCLQLPETDREHGYRIKNQLQNLLLETYGETFHLAPHPCNADIVLIKHNALPSIDACHADLKALSVKALDTVGSIPSAPAPSPTTKEAKGAKSRKQPASGSPKEAVSNAELLLEQYEYPQAEELLATIRISAPGDMPTLIKAARMLTEQMGAYQRAIELLLAQPRHLLKDKVVRELLAMTYYGNGSIAEARALFETAEPGDLEKGSLYAYADISFKDGNLSQAFYLLKVAEEKEGFVTTHTSLRKELEAAMFAEAEPYLQQAEAAFACNDLSQAQSLLQRALSHYPNFKKARELAGEVEAMKTGAEVERLWERLGSSEKCTERLDLLARLLERDKERGEHIRDLLIREKNRQKQEAVEERLDTLRALAAQERWEECYDNLLWLSRQAAEADYHRACAISPYFSALCHNKGLRKLSDENAMEQWLRFIRVKRQVQQGNTEGCWEMVQDLQQYFYGYPLFKELYDTLLELESAKARREADQLLSLMDELDAEEERDALATARKLYAQLQKSLAVLPATERAAYKEDAKHTIRRLEPETEWWSPLDYREALILGNSTKAAQIRETLTRPFHAVFLDQYDNEVTQMFAISAEAIPMIVSPDLVVDLSSELAEGLNKFYFSDRHVLLREDEETIIVLNMWRMSATKYRSPNFKDLDVIDCLPDKDVFLLVNSQTNNTIWRATLSEMESRFTAAFDINENFDCQDDAVFKGIFMSSSKDNSYYAVIREGSKFRVVKQSIDLVTSTVRTYQAPCEELDAFRLSYQPDRFLALTENYTHVLESNLDPPRGCSRIGSTQGLNCLGIDAGKSQIYAFGDGIVNVLNTKLRAVKQYLNAATVAHMTITLLAAVCPEKDIALVNVDGRKLFYNMKTNMFSQKFSGGRVLGTETPSRWYYTEIDTPNLAVKVKDITDELDTLLEWQVFLPAGADEDAAVEFVKKLEDPDFFSIVQSAPPGEPPPGNDTKC
ncbi:hypothetical protein KP001_04470 [Geomonas subterranea]|uniref:Tetratricopeptide repeat-containing protein n=1 Tax=Geomonas subterranea TaxID=2847989 RepID=A0ABX8LIE7_9BACT|nr:hypothetical protein [Geomonas subterranea]QXE91803.1 hypothetical protein KP001_04470 [Geomonas subterranea]QXM10104.1 hypothetical protein KP002_03025 [Geomonas subterranea]